MPFFIEEAELNVFSLEELSYYLLKNIYLLDKNLMGEELSIWLEEELEEVELANQLRMIRQNQGSGYQYFMTILMASGYCSKKQLKEMDEVLRELQNKSEFQRRKMRADYFFQQEKYKKAIIEYQLLLEKTDLSKDEKALLDRVWHNLGCAYGSLFLYEEAMHCFKKSYEMAGNPESLQMVKYIEKKMKKELSSQEEKTTEPKADTIEKRAREDAVDTSLEKENMSCEKENEWQERLWKIVREWKKEYRSRSVS